ncbi:FKBP-type peptidylprolyl cis-trans isomerase [Tieghemostelium lacteum]|uniref:peptidylprolyl isomerase n=1 Tax=Tieghemostelium lacteum TaxID=361077 RepID=A0A151Z5C5_TIELA|nr:FKBP-type peptidylprolyl cis-trans isomerase [Tieghemostelium lacteum]|eukprot:KYQ89138.1 FKBP-type peptidylprolyl cis-trans isomerase [Tieghemostelium lacteum]
MIKRTVTTNLKFLNLISNKNSLIKTPLSLVSNGSVKVNYDSNISMISGTSTSIFETKSYLENYNSYRFYSSKVFEVQGVKIEETHEGEGEPSQRGHTVEVRYTGKLLNGKVFDASGSRTFSFKLGANRVIQGWEIGVLGMKKGGKRTLTIPFALAYGKNGYPPVIPPSADLIFDVEVVDFK